MKLYLIEHNGKREEQTYTFEELKLHFLQNKVTSDNAILECKTVTELTKTLTKYWIFGYTIIELN